MDKATFLEILERFLHGRATAEEEAFIDIYYRLFAHDPSVLERLTPKEEEKLKLRIKARIDAKLYPSQHAIPSESRSLERRVPGQRILGIPVRYLVPTAAALVLAALTLTMYLIGNRTNQYSSQYVDASITPGGNRATLTLADGRTIPLSEVQDGIVISGDQITYSDGTDLVPHMQTGPVEMIQLETPRGGTYQVTLPDGSRVWLNAASTLSYPTQFLPGEGRVVSLEGEAYFEVAQIPADADSSPDGHRNVPFLVESRGQVVKVLGTQFNINAYANEPVTSTTLVEGRVEVSALGSTSTQMLSPGTQAVLRGSEIGTRKVDVSQYTAWKDGLFNIEGQSLRQVMQQLERWYDIEVAYDGRVDDVIFRGKISRNTEFQEVLYIFRKMGIQYKIDGRKLTLTERSN